MLKVLKVGLIVIINILKRDLRSFGKKEILEIEVLAKNYYSKSESNLKQILERKRSMVRKEELKKEEKERKGINCEAKS